MNSANTPVPVLDAALTLQLPLSGVKLIEASAGTGKTYAISNLYLRYVLAGRKVSEILVVTFTNAATDELRGRIRARLYEAQRCIESLQNDREPTQPQDEFLALQLRALQGGSEAERVVALARLRLAVRTMDEASIFTIHGYCQRALRNQAFNSGQAFELELLSEEDTLWTDALKDWWRCNAYNLDPIAAVLFSRVVGPLPKFLKAQKPLREARDKSVLPQIEASLASALTEWSGLETPLRVLAQNWQDRAEELKDILRHSGALQRNDKCGYRADHLKTNLEILDLYFASSDLLTPPQQLQLLAADYLRTYSTNTKRDSDPRLQDGFFLQCQQLIDDMARITKRIRIASWQEATEFARLQIERVKSANQTISYSDLLTRLEDALRGPNGTALAHALKRAFPVAMIDEFQDTDNVQYSIFKQVYLAPLHDADLPADAHPAGLIMIGDPKQAIYSFRGGDIFAYAEARHDAGKQRYTLDTNWRSVPGLITACNTLFSQRPTPFVYGEAIDFLPVQAADRTHACLSEHGSPVSPCTVWTLPYADDGKPIGSKDIGRKLSEAVADEIARLLRMGKEGSAKLGEKPVLPGDIATLVRSHHEGSSLREALLRRGISAVTGGRANVLDSAEARGLELLLTAVVHCRDRSSLRAALSSNLLGLGYAQIAEILDAQERWLQWTEQMQALHMLWVQRGFMPMFSMLVQQLQIDMAISRQALAERHLTNLWHLAEIIQQSAKTHSGLEQVLAWYRDLIMQSGDDETELRLESDEALVKIITIHASKGLEYPIVFIPFLWSCKPVGRNADADSVMAFHSSDGRPCLDLGSDQRSQHLLLAEKERLAEDVRLAYVALTRARAKVYLVWGDVGRPPHVKSPHASLAWLLHSQQRVEDLDKELPVTSLSEEIISAGLAKLERASGGTIEVVPLPQRQEAFRVPAESESAPLAAKVFGGTIATDWRINSFSSLTRDIHQPGINTARASSADAILNFPAGSHVGLFLHHLLEHLDFQGDINAQALTLNQRFAPRFGLDAKRYEAVVGEWLYNIVHTALNEQGLSLSQLPRSRRLDELEFDFSVAACDVHAMHQLLTEWAGQILNPVSVENFRGLITGVIDLVFESEGKFYIADYKSNLLGKALEDYAPVALRKAIFDRRYDLQYLLYVLALHRYLRGRIVNYSYSVHMGGVFYLFLRGMRPATGPHYGVYHDLPSQALIETLDRDIFGFQAAAVKGYS